MKTFIAALALMSSSAVFAWGNTGHRVVGEVAQKYLELETLVQVHKILDGQSLARVANWPDEIKSEPTRYSHTYNWHYTTWPSDVHDHGADQETATTGFLLKSINDNLAVLKKADATKEEKAFALKFIVHLIGDIHQPLHVGSGNDQGGNFCKVTYMSKQVNLHALWDETMIDYTNLSFTEIARFVTETHKSNYRAFASGNTLTWAQESREIQATLYPADVVPPTEPMSTRVYCQKDVLPEQMPKLSYEYAYKFVPVVEKRLYQAGVRLAMLLNENLK